jgi:hypothetical protein
MPQRTPNHYREFLERKAGPAAAQFVQWVAGDLMRQARLLALRQGLTAAEAEDVARVTAAATVKAASGAVNAAVNARAFQDRL